ncbi:hypothetical protein AVEN_89552-1 [Araneus ventricosus]|uniref:Uncharacterized protein n=1 Tax=Araneus ventricosus TaxID=182803 RepID=A0A4Y2UUB5_ARAVE|nr:hypothetical protein AVEN_89552-1 [Araneus ventricosus]
METSKCRPCCWVSRQVTQNILCLWDSRARDLHWTKTDWSLRGALTPGEKNVVNTTLVPPEKVLLPPLHLKLARMQQYIKSLSKYVECFRYPKTVRNQVEGGSFYSPRDTKTVIRFLLCRNNGGQRKKSEYVVHRFLENTKNPLYKTIVQRMLTAYEAKGCKMSLKVHFL